MFLAKNQWHMNIDTQVIMYANTQYCECANHIHFFSLSGIIYVYSIMYSFILYKSLPNPVELLFLWYIYTLTLGLQYLYCIHYIVFNVLYHHVFCSHEINVLFLDV